MIYIGDCHGNFNKLKEQILKKVENENLILLGDVGLGFGKFNLKAFGFDAIKGLMLDFVNLNATLYGSNNHLYLLRGNHDDPGVWKIFNDSFDYITFVNDYDVLTIEDKKILFVGGGISIDRSIRTENVNWWKGENIPKIPKNIVTDVDILATHVPLRSTFATPAPTELLDYYVQRDPELLKDIEKEEKILKKLDEKINKKWWVSAHFHRSDRNYTDDCNYINLDILETFEIK